MLKDEDEMLVADFDEIDDELRKIDSTIIDPDEKVKEENEDEEAARDQLGEEPPGRIDPGLQRDEAEDAEIPRDVVDEHRQQGDAARDIDGRDAGWGRGGGIHRLPF